MKSSVKMLKEDNYMPKSINAAIDQVIVGDQRNKAAFMQA